MIEIKTVNKNNKNNNDNKIIRERYNKFGSAQKRYLNDNIIRGRKEIFKAIVYRAKNYLINYNITGGARFKQKHDQLIKQAYRYKQCCFEYIKLKCGGCSRYYIAPNRCECRICPHCLRKYAVRARNKIFSLVQRLELSQKKKLMHLTLTLKGHMYYEPNEFDVRRFGKYVKKLMHKLYPKKTHGCGAFGIIEMGGKNNIVHMHLLVYGYYYPKEYISKCWLEITGDSYIINISEVRGLRKCVNYLLKYLSKPPNYEDPNKIALYLDTLTGTRRIRTYGIFYNFPIFKKESFPCPICGGMLLYDGSDGCLAIPLNAIFIEDIIKKGNETINIKSCKPIQNEESYEI